MKHKFIWEDGRTFEFDHFPLTFFNKYWIYDTDDDPGHNTNMNVALWVDKEAYNASHDKLYDPKIIRVGILSHPNPRKCLPFPQGTYLPFSAGKILLKGLTGDLIIHDDYTKKSASEN